MTNLTNRTWTATITVHGETFDAELSPANLKRDQLQRTAREASEYLGNGDHAEIDIYKTTKAHGTVVDTSRTVSLVDGKVWVQ